MGEFGSNPENIQKGIESRRRNTALKKELKIPRPLKAIRLKCLECMSKSAAEIQRCHIEECSLWPFRFGHNPIEDDLMVPEYDQWGEKNGEHLYRSFT